MPKAQEVKISIHSTLGLVIKRKHTRVRRQRMPYVRAHCDWQDTKTVCCVDLIGGEIITFTFRSWKAESRKGYLLLRQKEDERLSKREKQSSGFCPSSQMFPLQRRTWQARGSAIWMELQFVYSTCTITLSIDVLCRYYSNLFETRFYRNTKSLMNTLLSCTYKELFHSVG